MVQTQLAIVGAGPVGIELAIALKRRGIEYLHLEAKQIGQTMFWWPPGTRWFSSNQRIAIGGVPLQTADQSKASREEYLGYLRAVVQQFDLRINTYEPVVSITKASEGFQITTEPDTGQRQYLARRVVLATGGTAQPRPLHVPGEGLRHVSHYLEDPHKYFRRRVLVVGGGNSAVEAALRCHHVGAEVAISYRGDAFDARSIKFWLYPEIASLIKGRQIAGYFNSTVNSIEPGRATLNIADGSQQVIPADFVLLMIGYLADMSLAAAAGVELVAPDNSPRHDPRTMETNIPGLYVAGTAIGGTQEHYRVFLENCHIHVDRIVAAICGQPPPDAPIAPLQAES